MSKTFESDRVLHTKQLIKDVFINQYINKNIDSISIKKITEEAGLNRGTFYIHYQDIYDLLDEIEDEILSELNKLISRLKDVPVQNINLNTIKPILIQALEYVQEKNMYFKAFLGQNGSPSFMKKLKQVAKLTFLDKLRDQNKLGEYSEYLIEYIISSNVGIIVYWLETGMKMSCDELTNLMSKTMLSGPLAYFLPRR